MTRRADVKRQTAETSILVSMDLDGTGKADIRTGIGFFDHMLHQIARHGQIDLTVMCDGDLHIDGHHSVEDIGIAMGQCLAKALGDKAGITRFGSAYVPVSYTHLDVYKRQDMWIAYCLIEAARIWNDPSYLPKADGYLAKLKELVRDVPTVGKIILPGRVGFEEKGVITINPSYYPPHILRRFEIGRAHV